VVVIGDWSLNESRQLCLGVAATGRALQLQFGGGSAKDTFKRVLMRPGNTEIAFARVLSGDPECATDNNNVAPPRQSIVTCYGPQPGANAQTAVANALQFTEFTTVHELGHVFVGRTGGYSPNITSYFNLIFNPVENGTPVGAIYDSAPTPQTVYGMYVDVQGTPDWVRGGRGWGSPASIPPSAPCSFQQNAFSIRDGTVTPPPPPTQNPLDRERDEASADMYLNWVYRRLSVDGFRNEDQRNITNCLAQVPTDTTDPGDARYEYLNNVIMPTLATFVPTPTPTP
jgi:hypothetical protein